MSLGKRLRRSLKNHINLRSRIAYGVAAKSPRRGYPLLCGNQHTPMPLMPLAATLLAPVALIDRATPAHNERAKRAGHSSSSVSHDLLPLSGNADQLLTSSRGACYSFHSSLMLSDLDSPCKG